jgi:hypothetical protein
MSRRIINISGIEISRHQYDLGYLDVVCQGGREPGALRGRR